MTTNPNARLLVRDVFFAGLRSPEDRLGCVRAASGMANKIFYSIVNSALVLSEHHDFQDSAGELVPRDESQPLLSHYLHQIFAGLAGTTLNRQLLDDDRRAPDALRQWHFEQPVLCHARGAGEPCFKHDFPPGSDMMGEILRVPKAADRMESEQFTRLGASQILPDPEGEDACQMAKTDVPNKELM